MRTKKGRTFFGSHLWAKKHVAYSENQAEKMRRGEHWKRK